MDWFSVDKEGLAKLLSERSAARALLELVQNALDTDAEHIEVTVTPMSDGLVRVTVEDDDPTGFVYLAHAYTLFAESTKKADPLKRGRFNLGEKIVLALCETASIATTTGTVTFDSAGRHENVRLRRKRGSRFDAIMHLSETDVAEIHSLIAQLLLPPVVQFFYNGAEQKARVPDATWQSLLPTEFADSTGRLRRTERKAEVEVYPLMNGEKPHLYELGIPVVAWKGTHHVNVRQKVPLNMERNNVTPAYADTLGVEVLNHTIDLLPPEVLAESWVGAVLDDTRMDTEAVAKVIKARFGDKAVAFDPTDLQANKEAAAQGFIVVGGRNFSKDAWQNIRRAGLLPRAGDVTPGNATVAAAAESAKDLVPTSEQQAVLDYAAAVGTALLGKPITARIVSDVTEGHNAWYGSNRITFNLGRLGKAWFAKPNPLKVDELLIHEFAHDVFAPADHLDHGYFDALCVIGARFRNITLRLVDFGKGE